MLEIRAERSIGQYSRGAALTRAIVAMWEANRRLPPGANDVIAERIRGILSEYDLTLDEWHYWCQQVTAAHA